MKIKISRLDVKFHRFVMLTECFLSLKSIPKLKNYWIKICKCLTKKENYWLKPIKVDRKYYKKTLNTFFNKTNKFKYRILNK